MHRNIVRALSPVLLELEDILIHHGDWRLDRKVTCDEREKGGPNRKYICDKHRAEYIQNRPNKVRYGVMGHSTPTTWSCTSQYVVLVR